MKSTFLKPLATLFILFLTVACSIESEEDIEQLITVNSISNTSESQTDQQGRNQSDCGDPNIFITDGDHNFYYIYVEYEPSSTKYERGAIRNPFCDRIVSITPCELNKDAEIWHIKGLCPTIMDCKPDIVKPTDPNLRLATFANTCQ